MRVTILTLFPLAFDLLKSSVLGRGLQAGLWQLDIVDLREFGIGARKSVDGPCYGGGAGMVLRPDVLDQAMESVGLQETSCGDTHCVYLSSKGRQAQQEDMAAWSQLKHVILLCGRYEGVDQRALDFWHFQEIGVGSFVVCGGEAPAMMLVEGTVRLIPGILGNPDSLIHESFQEGFLEHPHYTRPRVWKEQSVPEVLVSGHHQRIAQWRREASRPLSLDQTSSEKRLPGH